MPSKLSTAPLFFFFWFSFIYIDCRKLNLQSIHQRFKPHNSDFTVKSQKIETFGGHSVEAGILPKIKNILRAYSASLELPRNIYFHTNFTYEMRAKDAKMETTY